MLPITVRNMLRIAGAFALAASLVACGGARDETEANALSVGDRISVKGADGASVSYLPAGNHKSQAVTVRVARDGSGAPPLPAGYVAAGAVYQFTPLGLARPGIEVRVPLDATAANNGAVDLLVAQPGGPWMHLTNVKTEGNLLIANVPQLAYATAVVASSGRSGARPADKSDPLNALQSTTPPPTRQLTLSVDASTSPAVPAPLNGDSYSVITQPTQLVVAVGYDLVGACDGNKTVTVIARINDSTDIQIAQQTLSGVKGQRGTLKAATPISAAQANGLWSIRAVANCPQSA
jgi:hypothetical protein